MAVNKRKKSTKGKSAGTKKRKPKALVKMMQDSLVRNGGLEKALSVARRFPDLTVSENGTVTPNLSMFDEG